MTCTCFECGHEFEDDEDESVSIDEWLDLPPEERGAFSSCAECGVEIRYGEWHTADEELLTRELGEDDDATRYCGPCSDRDLSEFPDDGQIAGVSDE